MLWWSAFLILSAWDSVNLLYKDVHIFLNIREVSCYYFIEQPFTPLIFSSPSSILKALVFVHVMVSQFPFFFFYLNGSDILFSVWSSLLRSFALVFIWLIKLLISKISVFLQNLSYCWIFHSYPVYYLPNFT